MRETNLERYASIQMAKIGAKAYKWVCPGVSGVPDRICIFPGGRIVFVEFKRPGLKDGRSARQKKLGRILESLGCIMRRISCKEEFKKLMEELGYEI